MQCRVPPVQLSVSRPQHQVLHWYAGERGVPVARLLLDQGLNDVLTDAWAAWTEAGFVVPENAEIVKRQQDSNAAA